MDFNDFVFRDHAAENLGTSLEVDGDTARATTRTAERRAVGRALVGSLGFALLSSVGRMKH